MEPTKAESDAQNATLAAETASLTQNEQLAHQELLASQTELQPQSELPATATEVAASNEPMNADPSSQKGQLATRTHRLLASLIDSFIHLLVFIPLIWFVGLETFKNLSPLQTLLVSLYSMTTYLLIHGYLLYHYGQTIGKSEFGMRIQLLNGEKASLQHVMLWRYLPIMLMTFVPVIGQFLSGIFNVLFIFGKQRRCLHDYIAGTEVRYYYDMPQQSPPN